MSVTDLISEVTTSGSEITVRGTLASLPNGTVGVTANGTAGLVEGNQFVVRLPADPSMTSLTLTVRDSVAHLTLDADGDGTVDADETSIDTFTFTYAQPGLYLPRLTVTDTDGNSHTTVGIVHAADPVAMDARLQPVWQGVKDALRVGDVTSAGAFIHSDTRETYQTMWNQLPPDVLANIDQIITQIQLVEVGPAGAQYDMRRDKDGQTFSFGIWFQLDQDGLWRLLRF